MKLSIPLFEKYVADPLGCDALVRRFANVPEDRYFSVGVWPEPGVVTRTLSRTVAVKKISKSP